MRSVLVVVCVFLSACEAGGSAVSGGTCIAGTHRDDAGKCVVDGECLASTCAGHGTCAVVDNVPACTCDGAYTSSNCGECAVGFQDNAVPGTCVPDCSMSPCGAFGMCDDTSGTATCVCSYGTTGGACDACAPPSVTIINDPFGGPGAHHMVTVQPGSVVVAQLPKLTNPTGTIMTSQVTASPNGTLKYTLAFSRCPGDQTAFWMSQNPSGQYPCHAETTNYAAPGLISWDETTGHFSRCKLPVEDGPWYANFRVDYDAAAEACTGMIGGCKIDWQWN